MNEQAEITPELPKDTIKFEYDHLTGCAYVYEPDRKSIREVAFTVRQPQVLSPFKYNKPIENPTNPQNPPIEIKLDEKPREGVRPIALVRQALRPPNHLYEVDDAILCAVKNPKTKQWETRYFPKNSLAPEVWQEAIELLNFPE